MGDNSDDGLNDVIIMEERKEIQRYLELIYAHGCVTHWEIRFKL